MGNRVSVTVSTGIGRPRQVAFDPDATVGAVVGANLVLGNEVVLLNGQRLPAGYVLTASDIMNGLQPAQNSSAVAGGATNLSYDAGTRVLSSSTGNDATLPIFTSGDAGLAPSSGGGTANFLRADGQWVAPSGGVSDGDKGDIVVSGGGLVWELDAAVEAFLLDRANHTGQQPIASITGLSAALTWTAATLTIPSSTTSHRQVVSAPSITLTSKVEVMLAPVEDTDENDPELLDLVVLHATPKPATGEIEFLITFSSPTSGPIPILYRSF